MKKCLTLVDSSFKNVFQQGEVCIVLMQEDNNVEALDHHLSSEFFSVLCPVTCIMHNLDLLGLIPISLVSKTGQ